MIEATAIPEQTPTARQASKSAREDFAAGFSFSAAMTALEGRAAQSLETFGAAPQNAGPSTVSPKTTVQQDTNQASASKEQPVTDIQQRQTSAAASEKPAAPLETQISKTTPSLTASAAPAQALPTIAANVAAPIVPQQTLPQARNAEILPVKLNDAARLAPAKAPRVSASLPQAPVQDFAKLVAQRMHTGATSFELRLDPPELGRVEANLQVADDGDAVLALKFENQTTLDLFARDESALRNALLSSGFNLDGEKLAFTLADENSPTLNNTSDQLEANASYDPLFIAPYSSGAVDIRT